MKPCTDPRGHEWMATSFQIRACSTPVQCDLCKETGYLLEDRVVDREEGQPGEELF